MVKAPALMPARSPVAEEANTEADAGTPLAAVQQSQLADPVLVDLVQRPSRSHPQNPNHAHQRTTCGPH